VRKDTAISGRNSDSESPKLPTVSRIALRMIPKLEGFSDVSAVRRRVPEET